MELPIALRQAVDLALTGHSPGELARAADALSARYRAEVRDGKLHLADPLAAKAYLAVRLPATFAAVRMALESVGELQPDWAPATQLDVGSGPGTAIWAAESRWPALQRATAVEASPTIRDLGAALRKRGVFAPPFPPIEWIEGDITGGLLGLLPHDLVTAAYVLNELSGPEQLALAERLWALTAHTLILVEPGTPAGWQRILAVRARLLELGASIVAPCPHAAACPLLAPDWCHFSRRVARARIHQLVKGAELAWEDEKYIYLAVSRAPRAAPADARVLVPPRHATGRVALKLCTPGGTAEERLITKREGEIFKRARRVEWGDTLATSQ
jgi:ribosomal protein RSM22 (predicted rRNA methylase)